jgi:hypothetical protein
MPVGNFKRWITSFQKKPGRLPMVVAILAAAGSAFGQDALNLSSGSVVAGQTISLDLSLTAPTTSGPAGLEWTYVYSANDFSSVTVVAGPAAVAAGKSVSCSGGSGSYTCMLFGINTTTMSDGVVATATFTTSPAATSASSSVQILNTSGVTPDDTMLSVTATGGLVTISSPYTATGLTCSPATVITPGSAACTVTVSAPAPTGGLTVATGLASGSPVTIPSSVVVPAGSSSAGFTATASTVSANSTAVLAASLNGTSINFTLALAPPPPPPVTLMGLTCSSTLLTAHTSATCKITLSAAAPGGGLNIAIRLTNAVSLNVPSSVTAAAGSTSVQFSIQTGGVNSNQATTLVATLNGSSVSIGLTLSGSKHHH